MRTEFKRDYYLMESDKSNWWFASRQDCIIRLLYAHRVPYNARILEIGCAGGNIISALQQKGFTNIHGIDNDPDAIAVCKKRGLRDISVQAGEATNFSSDNFDALIASDVLEHIKDDARALKEWLRILKPGGLLLLFVPAFSLLWSEKDIWNEHYRRYRAASFLPLVEKQGFSIKRYSYWNFLLFFPAVFVRFFSRMIPHRFKPHPRPAQAPLLINAVFTYFIMAENWLLTKGVRYPVGTSLFVLATKQN